MSGTRASLVTSWITHGKQIVLRVFQQCYKGAWGEFLAAGEPKHTLSCCTCKLSATKRLQPLPCNFDVSTARTTGGLGTNIKKMTDQKYLKVIEFKQEWNSCQLCTQTSTHCITKSLIQEGICNRMTRILCGENWELKASQNKGF